MAGDVFGDLYIHVCDIVRATTLNTPSPRNPQTIVMGVDFDNPAATTTDVSCRLMSVSAQQRAELLADGADGTSVSTHIMQLPYDAAPSTLRDLDASPAPSVTHRVQNVRREDDESVVDAGWFDVLYVHDPSGEQVALILLLRRVN